jgi:hypothetical protein
MLLAMEKKKLFITFLSAAAFVVGCDKEKTTRSRLTRFKLKRNRPHRT